MLHIFLHFLIPAGVASGIQHWKDAGRSWWKIYGLMMVSMLVDLDHLMATPIYDPERCSIGFHPLHSVWAIVIYVGLLGVPKTRLVGMGLLIHMGLDLIDCYV